MLLVFGFGMVGGLLYFDVLKVCCEQWVVVFDVKVKGVDKDEVWLVGVVVDLGEILILVVIFVVLLIFVNMEEFGLVGLDSSGIVVVGQFDIELVI